MSVVRASDEYILPGKLRWFGLAAILLVAAAFRFYGLFWGMEFGAHPHPDEQYLADRMFRVSLKQPINWAQLLDPRSSPLNPRRFNPATGQYYRLDWGAFLLYVTRGVSAALDALGWHALDTYEGYFYVGRVISALCSLLTIPLVFWLGALVFGDRAGLLAAAALALTVTHIQLGHFMAVDGPLTLFATATLAVALRFARRGGRADAGLMGACTAGALTCKVTGGTLLLAVGAAYVLRCIAEREDGRRWPARFGHLAARYAPWTGLGFLLVFGTIEFYALLNLSSYLASFLPLLAMGSGENDAYFTRQFVNTPAFLFQIENLVRWGMGWPLGVLSLLAALWACLKGVVWTLKTRSELARPEAQGILVIAAWAAPYFVYLGALEVKYGRYQLPLAPVLCVFGGGLLIKVSGWLKRRWRLPEWLLPLAILAPTLAWALAYLSIYARPHTWLEASRWLYSHAAPGAVIASPDWDQPLPVDIPAEGRRREQVGAPVMLQFFQDMSPENKFAHLSAGLRQAEMIVLPTPRAYGAVRRLPWRYPVEIRFFQLLFEEKLGYELVHMVVSYPSLGPLLFVDDAAEEAFSVFDHPKVLIYQKKSDLQSAELRALFAEALAVVPVVSRRGHLLPAELPAPGLDSKRVRALLRNVEG